MAYGVLTNDRSRYNRAVELYHTTVKDYLRWGRGQWVHVAPGWRAVGEASETLRDIYHTQFALGGMLQVAEMAWQQVGNVPCIHAGKHRSRASILWQHHLLAVEA